MRRLALLGLLAAACLLALAGTAGATTPHQITCDTQHNYAMQCKASSLYTQTTNPLLSPNLRAATLVTYGTDTYGGAAGVASSTLTHFNCSYLSGVAGKDWTTADINAWHARGKPTCVVFEQGATQAEDGFGQGNADAHKALSEANALGIPSYVPIHFAVDTDASGAAVKEYFLGAKSVLGPRTGAYGSYFVIRDLVEWGIISNTAAWQTIAWSERMVWTSGALLQYAIPPMAGTTMNGEGVDLDLARGDFYGQWPFSAAPKANPHRYGWLPSTKRRFHAVGLSQRLCNPKAKKKVKGCHLVRATARSAAHTFDNVGCQLDKRTHHFKRHVCKVKAQHLRLLAGRWWTIAHKTKNLKHKVKKPRWSAVAYHPKGHKTTIGGAYRQMHRRIVATGPIRSW